MRCRVADAPRGVKGWWVECVLQIIDLLITAGKKRVSIYRPAFRQIPIELPKVPAS